MSAERSCASSGSRPAARSALRRRRRSQRRSRATSISCRRAAACSRGGAGRASRSLRVPRPCSRRSLAAQEIPEAVEVDVDLVQARGVLLTGRVRAGLSLPQGAALVLQSLDRGADVLVARHAGQCPTPGSTRDTGACITASPWRLLGPMRSVAPKEGEGMASPSTPSRRTTPQGLTRLSHALAPVLVAVACAGAGAAAAQADGTLTVTPSALGRVTGPGGLACGTVCSVFYPSQRICLPNPPKGCEPFTLPQSVTVQAEPAPGWSFGGWGGACSGVADCR